MKVATVVGARPQFIKAAVVSHVLRQKHQEILIHTGQHHDYNMSDRFFEQLNIPRPDYNLGISGGTHAQMTGQMMIALEDVLQKENPDWLLVYGDTNSTLAAALAAAKLHIKICHVEAGCRTHCKTNPEEINRVCTDHVSSLLLASTQSSIEELNQEGLGEIGFLVGDTMYDAFIQYSGQLLADQIRLELLNGQIENLPKEYFYLTCHREENTGNDEPLLQIFKAMNALDLPTVYPVHPRNRQRAVRLQEQFHFHNLILTQPVGYLESTCMVKHANKVVTDSGGLQKEAFFAGKKCVTILNFVCCPETMVGNRNVLCAPKAEQIISELKKPQKVDSDCQPFGNGHAAVHIVKALEEYS